jgi:adenylate cyclase
MERRLSAILAADVMGYSRLTERNEEASTTTLRAYRAVVEDAIAAHKGHVFSSAGDGLVAEFPSIVEAVRCAIEIQNEIAKRNVAMPDDERMHFRIGVNLGDVIDEENNLYGTGVNVAVRLEQLASPGGICISQIVYDQVRKIVELPIEDIGERRLKNIADPVHVYRILPAPLPWYNRLLSRPGIYLRRSTPVLISLLIFAVAAGVSFYLRQPAALWSALSPATPKRPTIAVLPFDNLSKDKEKLEFFSIGLRDDIIDRLARARDLRVLDRKDFKYEDARELGIGYVLTGNVQRENNDVHVYAKVDNVQTGAKIWDDQIDSKMVDIFLVQDEIVGKIYADVAGSYGAIERTERESASRRSPEEIQVYDLILQEHERLQWRWNRENFTVANEKLLEALAIDPDNARAHREQAYLNVFGGVFGYLDSPLPLDQMTKQASKAVEHDPADPRAHMVAAIAYFFSKQPERFESEVRQAFALAPDDPEILVTLGALIANSGQWQRGVECVMKADKLNSDASAGWYQSTRYLDDYMNGAYESARDFLLKSPDYAPEDYKESSFYAYMDSVPILGKLDSVADKKKASENWGKLLQDRPGWSLEKFKDWYRTWNFREEDIEKLADGVSEVIGLEAKARRVALQNPPSSDRFWSNPDPIKACQLVKATN